MKTHNEIRIHYPVFSVFSSPDLDSLEEQFCDESLPELEIEGAELMWGIGCRTIAVACALSKCALLRHQLKYPN
jgi:hypothetical protein